jgi:hypothetical protein
MGFILYIVRGESIRTFPEKGQHMASMAKTTGHKPVPPCWPILRNSLLFSLCALVCGPFTFLGDRFVAVLSQFA